MTKKNIKEIPAYIIAIVIVNLLLTLVVTWKVFKDHKKVDTVITQGVKEANEQLSKIKAEQTIGVINVQKILTGAKAAASINKQVEVLRTDFQKWIEAEEKVLRDKEANLVQSQPKLTEKEAQAKMNELKTGIAAFQQEAMERKQRIEIATNEGADKIKNTIVSIAHEIAKKKGITLILADTLLVYFHQGVDLTDEVLPVLNKQLPDVKIDVKKEQSGQKKK